MNIEEANKLVLEAHQSFQGQKYEIAQPLLEKVLREYPQHSRANEILAYIIGNLGDSSSSHELLKIACEDPNCTPQALYYLGSSYLELNIPEQAIQFLSASINKGGHFFEGLHDLATAQAMVGNEKEAIENFKKATALNPQSSEAFYNLGKAYDALKEYKEAVKCYDTAIQIWPDFAQAHFNKATALADLGLNELAVVEYRHAQSLMPDMELLSGNLIHAEMKLCDWGNLNTNTQNLMRMTRDTNHLASEPFSMISISDVESLNLKVATIFSNLRFPSKAIDKSVFSGKQKKQKIILGYFSANLHNHAVAYLISEIFEKHDREKFDLIAFSFGPISFGPNFEDKSRERLRKAFDQFIDISQMSENSASELVRNLEIDIAVDLKGHTQHARTKLFSNRLAPIQINYLGYPGSLGAPYIDYIIADPTLIPITSQNFYTEKIIYLPNSYQVNDSKRSIANNALTRLEVGLPENSFVFCCFNNNYKITPSVFDGWGRILKAVEGSVLWLLEGNPKARENLIKEAAVRGISKDRLVFAGRIDSEGHLARHRLADLFIDTSPCNAHTTASDALWAGLPVLTLLGDAFAGRVAASLLNAIGLPELIAKNQSEYEAMAIDLATHRDKLKIFKQRLELNRLISPLFNTQLTTRHIESAYSIIYDRYQSDLAPEHIYVPTQLQ